MATWVKSHDHKLLQLHFMGEALKLKMASSLWLAKKSSSKDFSKPNVCFFLCNWKVTHGDASIFAAHASFQKLGNLSELKLLMISKPTHTESSLHASTAE